MDFRYYLPVNLIFGRGKVCEVGRLAAKYGKRALIVTGASSTKRSGMLDKVRNHLKNERVDAMRKFLERIGLSVSLSEEGVTEDDIPWLTDNCFKVSAASIANHPAAFSSETIYRLYERALAL